MSAALKRTLYYRTMNDRKTQLEAKTIASSEWVWKSRLVSWLHGDDCLFWLCGKPASEKSTLMNYLARTQRLLDFLPPREAPWCVIQFYFDFRAGVDVANTPTGMIRSLLLQLVEKVPAICEFVHQTRQDDLSDDWNKNERELLNIICESVEAINVNICAFIDGLDEYKGRVRELGACLIELQERTKIKLMLASRPESRLETIMLGIPLMLMQEYNVPTIRAYIDTARELLQPFEASRLESLWRKVEQEAEGVILWAKFVVDELIDLTETEATTKELHEAFHSYPTDLQGVYSRIFRRLPAQHVMHAAIAFRCAE